MGKTRDHFKNQRYQENISCKDGHNKEQRWYGPNRSRRYQEEVARTYRRTMQKSLNDPDNHDGVVSHLEPDILQCDVKGLQEVLLQTKLVEVMEFQLSYLKS